jgi:hypothetical protein
MSNLTTEITDVLKEDPIYAELIRITQQYRAEYPDIPFNVSKMMEPRKHIMCGMTFSGNTVIFGPEYTITGIDFLKLTEENGEMLEKANSDFFFDMLSVFPEQGNYVLEAIQYADVIHPENDIFGEKLKIVFRGLTYQKYELHGWAFEQKDDDGEWDFILSTTRKDMFTFYNKNNQAFMLENEDALTEENKDDEFWFNVESYRLSKIVFRMTLDMKNIEEEEKTEK